MADAAHTATQQRIAAIHASSALHRDFDTNCNGIIEPFETAAYQARIEAGLRTPEPTRAPPPQRQAVTAPAPRPFLLLNCRDNVPDIFVGGWMLRSVTVTQEHLP